MKTKYLAQLLSIETFSTWMRGKKVIICAPTGIGKTMFLLLQILPYAKTLGKRVLILCNRRLLREQYIYDLLVQYVRYADMEKDITVLTYQHLAEELRKHGSITSILKNYDVVAFDEVHYFYCDSDFNAYGTYVLLQALVRECFYKTIIMVTATVAEVLPLIETTYKNCAAKLKREGDICPCFENYEYQGQIYDFAFRADYDRFSCFYVEDEESLCAEIANADGKTVMFIDDKQKAEAFRKDLIRTKKVQENEVFFLNADVLDEKIDSEEIRQLALAHMLPRKILITTSVLDNGVSIHDPDVKNVVIATESQVSFLQMVGRIRAEKSENCKLYIFPRQAEYFLKRVRQCEERLKFFKYFKNKLARTDGFNILLEGWYGNDEKSDLLRKVVVLTTRQNEYYGSLISNVVLRRGDTVVAINEFAREKIGNQLLAQKKFLRLATCDPKLVAVEQIAWLGKNEAELIVKNSSYMASQRKMLKEYLLEIQDFDKDELQKQKEKISAEFKDNVLCDVLMKSGTFSQEKMEQICKDFDLVFVKKTGEDRRQRYYVKEGEKECC